jgi:hypothetical protein
MTTFDFNGPVHLGYVIDLKFDRATIEKKDTTVTVAMLNVWKEHPLMFRNSLRLSFEGYENDVRKPWKIPDIVSFFQMLDREVPWLLLFISPQPPLYYPHPPISPDLADDSNYPLHTYLSLVLAAQYDLTLSTELLDKMRGAILLAPILKKKLDVIMDLFPRTVTGDAEAIAVSVELAQTFKDYASHYINR